MKLVKWQFFFLPALVFCTQLGANSAVNHYLLQARDMPAFQAETTPTGRDWLDNAEFRYSQSDDGELGLAFRFRPKFATERSAENRISELLQTQFSTTLEQQLNDELNLRYERLLDLISGFNQLQFHRQQTQLSEQELIFYRAQAQTENFRIADLQTAEFELQHKRDQLEFFESRLNEDLISLVDVDRAQLQAFLDTWEQQTADWDDFVINSSELLRLADQYQLQANNRQIDFQLARQKLKRLRGESANWLKHVEFKLVDKSSGEQEASIGLAFPLGGNQQNLSRQVAEVNRTGINLQASRLRIARIVRRSVSALHWHQQQSDLLNNALALLQRQFTQLGPANQPRVLFQIKKQMIRYQQLILDNRVEALAGFLKLMNETGFLSQKPLTNWMLLRQPPLEEF